MNPKLQLLWLVLLMGVSGTRAAEAYAVLSTDKTTLTFYYDNKKSSRTGTIYDAYAGVNRGWYLYANHITSVVFNSSFSGARPTSLASWFYGMTNLTSITNLSYLNTSSVTTMDNMFYNCKKLTSLDLSHFNTANVTDMGSMFAICSSLTSLDLSSFNTSKVTDMSWMFYMCSGLSSLDVSNFNTANVTDMHYMFSACPNLTTLDLSSFNTSKVTDMRYMFYNCHYLRRVNLSSFNTSKVTEMKGMFYFCFYMTSLDLSKFTIPSQPNSTADFMYNCHVDTLIVPSSAKNLDDNACWGVGSQKKPCKLIYPSGFTLEKQEEGDGLYKWKSGYFTDSNTKSAYAYLSSDNKTLSFYYDAKRWDWTGGTAYSLNEGSNQPGWLLNASSITNVVFDSSFSSARPTSLYRWFRNMANLTSITNLSYLNTSKVTDMQGMFYGCSSLSSLNLSKFTIPSSNTSDFIANCSGLKTLTVPSTANNLDANACTGVGTSSSPCSLVYPSGFTPQKDATGDGWYQWKSGYFTDSNTKSAYSFLSSDGKTLTFYYDANRYSRTGGAVYSLNEGSNQPGWHSYASSVTNVVFNSTFSNARPTSCFYWFDGMTNLTSITGLSYLNTSNVTDMTSMFSNCSALTNLNLSNFNTAKVTNMGAMFANCSGLSSLDVSNFNTAKVTDMSSMFHSCSGLTNLDVSNFNTAKVINMSSMFFNCSGFTSLDVSNFNTANVSKMEEMFGYCSSFTSLDLSNFIIPSSNTGDMMINCSALTSLTIPVTAINLNANACTGVGAQSAPCTLFYPSNFTPEKQEEGGGWYKWKSGYFKDDGPESYAVLENNALTFFYDDKRATRTGTSYDLNTGTVNPGWYDKRASITKVVVNVNFAGARPTTCYRWFAGTKIKGVTNFRYINTSQVTNMACMFTNCTSLESLDLAKFSTANVTTMEQMFSGCTKLTTLNLSKFNTSKVTNVAKMFDGCTGLTALDLSKFDFSKVSTAANSTVMMRNCSSLQKLTIPSTANKLGSFVCTGVGTKAAPCVLVYPAGFNVVKSETGDGWYVWKGGYFKDDVQFPLGDVNHDGYVTVVDASLTVDYVMGNTPPVFFIENADMNNDGSVTVTDISKIVDLVMNGPASHAPATAREATLDRLWLTADGSHCLLHLETPERYTAMHLTLRLPEGGAMGNVRLSSSRSAGHHAEMRPIGDGLYNIVLHADDNSELRDGDTALLSFDLAGCHPNDVEVVAIQSTNRLFETVMSGGTTTALEVVETDATTDSDSYNTVGVRVNKNTRGVVIKNGGKKIKY